MVELGSGATGALHEMKSDDVADAEGDMDRLSPEELQRC